VLALAAAGTKGSTLPLVIVGLVVSVAAAAVVNRSSLRLLVPELAVVVACFWLTLLVVFRDSAGGLTIDPRTAAQAAPLYGWLGGGTVVSNDRVRALVSLVVIFGLLARGAGMLFLLATRRGRRDPLTWFLAGAGLAGAGALAVLSHPGDSQRYFAYNAIPLLAIGAAAGLATLVDLQGTRITGPVLTGLVAGVLMVQLPWRLDGVLSPAGGTSQALRELALAASVLATAGLLAWLVLRPPRLALAVTAVTPLLVAGIATVASTDTMTVPASSPLPGVLTVSRS
jgi:hypothetical protein